MNQVQRNEPCPCGSGKKYKKCCMQPTHSKFGKSYIVLAVLAIFALSLFLRYYGFMKPHGLTFDEGLYAELLAPQLKDNPLNYSTQEAYRYQVSIGQKVPEYLDRPVFKHPPLFNYLIAGVYSIFGNSHLAAVSVSIMFGSLTIIIVFLLGRKLYDERIGLLSALLVCLDPIHWICSEKIWMETTMVFFMVLAVYLFVLGQKQKTLLLGCGISIGLATLTKYPGALSLIILIAYAIIAERRQVRLKDICIIAGVSLAVFSPWIIWNISANGFATMLSIHGLGKDMGLALASLQKYGYMLIAFILTLSVIIVFRQRIKKSGSPWVRHCVLGAIALILLLFPITRNMLMEAFTWKSNDLAGWTNQLKATTGWYFYFTRLCELSPFTLFGFLGLPLIFKGNRGDQMVIIAAIIILGSFTVIGNYQSRYILPAVPFMLILSSRVIFLMYDKLNASASEAQPIRAFAKIGLSISCMYFFIKTLKVDALLAIGPDFGYF